MKSMTRHARERAQQRGIPRLMIDLLQRFGSRAYDHRGCVIRYLDKVARRAVEKYIGSQAYRRLHEYHDAYLVEAIDTGAIVTCGYRYASLKTH